MLKDESFDNDDENDDNDDENDDNDHNYMMMTMMTVVLEGWVMMTAMTIAGEGRVPRRCLLVCNQTIIVCAPSICQKKNYNKMASIIIIVIMISMTLVTCYLQTI